MNILYTLSIETDDERDEQRARHYAEICRTRLVEQPDSELEPRSAVASERRSLGAIGVTVALQPLP